MSRLLSSKVSKEFDEKVIISTLHLETFFWKTKIRGKSRIKNQKWREITKTTRNKMKDEEIQWIIN